jgi:hypothetical protein
VHRTILIVLTPLVRWVRLALLTALEMNMTATRWMTIRLAARSASWFKNHAWTSFQLRVLWRAKRDQPLRSYGKRLSQICYGFSNNLNPGGQYAY